MSSNPINLAIRFLLEMATLFAVGFWGWNEFEGWQKYVMSIGIPTLLMVIWGVFAVPNDPSRSGAAPVKTPGLIRLILELSFFAFGVFALYKLDHTQLSWTFALIVSLHYIISYDRIAWLLKQKS